GTAGYVAVRGSASSGAGSAARALGEEFGRACKETRRDPAALRRSIDGRSRGPRRPGPQEILNPAPRAATDVTRSRPPYRTKATSASNDSPGPSTRARPAVAASSRCLREAGPGAPQAWRWAGPA